jgi:thioredoxin 1
MKRNEDTKMALVNVTKDNFEAVVLHSDKPVLLDFWATWCGPCQMIAPTVHAIAEERSDVVVGKVNVDEEGELAQAYGIISIPTLVFIKNGKEKARTVGVRAKADILAMLD